MDFDPLLEDYNEVLSNFILNFAFSTLDINENIIFT